MKVAVLFFVFITVFLGGFILILKSIVDTAPGLSFNVPFFGEVNERALATDELSITSNMFADGQAIPEAFSCYGENKNPSLTVEGVSPDAQSFVLIMQDLDAISGTSSVEQQYHWVVYNIPPWVRQIDVGHIPWSTEGVNSFGRVGYTGPCPEETDGVHRYRFTLYVLNTTLGLTERATVDEVREAMSGHVFGTASYTGTFRKR